MTEAIKTYLEADTEKIEQIIEKYPRQIPTKIVAELMGVSPENIRQAVSEGELGISWRKPGKLTGATAYRPRSLFAGG